MTFTPEQVHKIASIAAYNAAYQRARGVMIDPNAIAYYAMEEFVKQSQAQAREDEIVQEEVELVNLGGGEL